MKTKKMTTNSDDLVKKLKPLLTPEQKQKIKDEEWKVSLNHPKITPQLREMLSNSFRRLADLDVRQITLDGEMLSKAEELEIVVLTQLHDDFRCGRGAFAAFIGKKYFDRKYQPKV